MNTGTKLRTLLAIATSLNTALMATDVTGFENQTVDAVYRIASIVLNFVIVALVTYFNNDFTEEAAEYTGLMRLMKEQNAGVITGEDFLEDGAPIEDDAPDVETDDDAPDEDGEDFEDDDEDGGEE